MRWIIVLGVVALCVICGLLGLTAGINQNPESTVRFVPNWGSLADWVAGIGSLAAVGATVYFGWKQREDLIPKLGIRVKTAIAMLGNQSLNVIGVSLVNDGHVAVEVSGIYVTSDNSERALWFTSDMVMPGSSGFPTVVGAGKGVDILLDRHAVAALKGYVADECGGRADGLYLSAAGPIRDFSAPLPPDIARLA